jgi:pimeloyl-ACP methyl ester carboxylesterase
MTYDATGPDRAFVEVNGIELACLLSPEMGDTDRPLAVLLHGFPDSAHTWRHVTPRLEAVGYRVVAPFLRGYAPSAVPADGRYQIAAPALDAIGLHDRFLGDGRAVLIGHDWGAPISYTAAATEPDRWSRVVGLAVPPGPAFGMSLLTNLDQLKRSWYMFFFQSALAETVVTANDLAFVDMLWHDWSPGYDAGRDVALAKESLHDHAHLAAALGYYRAALGDGYIDPELSAVQHRAGEIPPQPLLYLHGADDGGIGAEVAEYARATAPDNVTTEIIEGVGHFLHLEAPDLVGDRIVGFVS